MARAAKTVIEEKMAATFPYPDETVTRMVSGPVEAWLRCQAGILKAVQPLATGWIERRRAGATAALETVERLALCRDWQEAAAIQRSWVEESMKRLDSDLQAFGEQALTIAQEAMSATRFAAQSSAEVVALAIQPAQRAAAEQQQQQQPRVDAAA